MAGYFDIQPPLNPARRAKPSSEAAAFISRLPENFKAMQYDALCKAIDGNLFPLNTIRSLRRVEGPLSPLLEVREMCIRSSGRSVRIRIYQPGPKPLQILVYYHGGGWCLNSIETCSRICQDIALRSGCAVVAPEYALAPESPYPAAFEDCAATVQWCFENRAMFASAEAQIVVGGDSAGGQMAASAAEYMHSRGCEVAGMTLFYPLCRAEAELTDSWKLYGSGYGLDSDLMKLFTDAYLPDAMMRSNPFASPLCGDASKFPPALILASECDILRDEALEFSQKLSDAGVPVRFRCLKGAIHLYITQRGMDDAYSAALSEAVKFMNKLKDNGAFYE